MAGPGKAEVEQRWGHGPTPLVNKESSSPQCVIPMTKLLDQGLCRTSIASSAAAQFQGTKGLKMCI